MSDSASVIDSRAAGETEAGSTGPVSGGGGGGSADEDNVRSSVAAEQQAVSASSAGELHSSGINPRQAPPQPLRQASAPFQQDFSWQTRVQQAGTGIAPPPAEAAYGGFYAYANSAAAAYQQQQPQQHRSAFSGDIRDSIAAIWSRTSPGAAGGGGSAGSAAGGGQDAFSGAGQHSYGHFGGNNDNSSNQFAANLTGQFAAGSDAFGMFGAAAAAAGGSDYAAYGAGQQYGGGGGGYGGGGGGNSAPQQYNQWPESNAAPGAGGRNHYSSYMDEPPRNHGGRPDGGRGGLGEAQQGLEGMKLSASVKDKASNGFVGLSVSSSVGNSSASSSAAPKKMSWASIASQPAKPTPAPAKAKKPGVLAPPTLIPSTAAKPAPAAVPPPVPIQHSQNGSGNMVATPDHMIKNEMGAIGPNSSMHHGGMQQQQQQHHQQPPMHHRMDHGPPPHHLGAPPPHGPPPHHPYHPMSMAGHHGGGNGGPPPMMTQQPPYHHGPPPGRGGGGGGMGGQNGPAGPSVAMDGPPRAVARAASATNGDMNSNGGVGGDDPSSGSSGLVRHPVLESLKNSNDYNPKTFDVNPKNARYFVIKSFSEDDIHRSIKYEIWCSTEHGNKRLDAAFRERNGQGPIYLFFSVNGSGHFCGVAEMLTSVDYSNSGSSVWVQDKFKGQFKVKWIYVKDVPNVQLRHIRLENNENKPVTNSRDTQEVPPDKAKSVLKIIHTFNHMTSILDDFVYYEKRQKEEEGKKAAANIPGMNDEGEGGAGGGGGRGGDRGDRGHRGGGGGGGMRGRDGGDHRRHHNDHRGGGGHRDNYHRGHDDGGPPHHRGDHRDGGGRRGGRGGGGPRP